MLVKRYIYEAPDGKHFPDAYEGENKIYTIDFSEWLTNEGDTLVSVNWVISDGITSDDNFLVGNTANIKVDTSTQGTYKLICTANTIEDSKTQTIVVPMVLKVYPV